MSFSRTLSIFGWLIWHDLQNIFKRIPFKLLDAVLIATNFIIVAAYILPFMGFPSFFGEFMWCAEIVAIGFIECSFLGKELIRDFNDTKNIEYFLTLPVPSWVIFLKVTLMGACNCFITSIMVLPLGKILLGHRLNLTAFKIIKCSIVLLLINLFLGIFAVWLSSWIRTTSGFSSFGRRIGNSLWFFGGYQFSWAILRKALPSAALFDLLNPLLYAFEGVRAAVIGQEGYISLSIACGMLAFFSFIFGIWSWVWLKKRLDCLN